MSKRERRLQYLREYAKKHYQKNKCKRKKQIKEYQENNKERLSIAAKAWKKRNTDKVKQYFEKYIKNNLYKRLAKTEVLKALKKGDLTKIDRCTECHRKTKLHGHHPNYFRPLEVIWLCRDCHCRKHKEDRYARKIG